jgi:cell division protein FtsB
MIETEILEKHLRKTTITANVISIIVGLVIALGVGYGFYYNTKSTLGQHTTDITKIKKDVVEINDHINDIDVFKGVSQSELNSLSDDVKKVEKHVEKMNDKLDQILIQTK